MRYHQLSISSLPYEDLDREAINHDIGLTVIWQTYNTQVKFHKQQSHYLDRSSFETSVSFEYSVTLLFKYPVNV